jgi:hypothetical protein
MRYANDDMRPLAEISFKTGSFLLKYFHAKKKERTIKVKEYLPGT